MRTWIQNSNIRSVSCILTHRIDALLAQCKDRHTVEFHPFAKYLAHSSHLAGNNLVVASKCPGEIASLSILAFFQIGNIWSFCTDSHLLNGKGQDRFLSTVALRASGGQQNRWTGSPFSGTSLNKQITPNPTFSSAGVSVNKSGSYRFKTPCIWSLWSSAIPWIVIIELTRNLSLRGWFGLFLCC